jgi:hypothetical protein
MGRGRIFITDHSSNGTFVNGMRIASDVDFPVRRKDVVSFANEIDLDWSLVPGRKRKLIFLYIGAAVVLTGVGVLLFHLFCTGDFTFTPPWREVAPPADSVTVKSDTLKLETADLPELNQPTNVGGITPHVRMLLPRREA